MKRDPNHQKAARHGALGCPAGTWRHGLTDQCYRCPDGYLRNLNIGNDPSKFQACTRVDNPFDEAAAEKRAKGLLNTFAGPLDNFKTFDVTAQSASDAAVPERADAAQQTDADRDRIAWMKKQIDHPVNRDAGIRTITFMRMSELSAGVGYAGGYGMAMSKEGDAYACRYIEGQAFMAGLTLGGGVGWEIAGFTGGLNDVAGESNGYVVSAGAGVSVGYLGYWTATGGHEGIGVTYDYAT